MTRKITKSNQSEQRSDRGAKRSDRGGADGLRMLVSYAIFGNLLYTFVFAYAEKPLLLLDQSSSYITAVKIVE